MEEELRKKEEELANLSKTYEERMKDAALANQVKLFFSYYVFQLYAIFLEIGPYSASHSGSRQLLKYLKKSKA